MTVKEVVHALKSAKHITLGYGDNAVPVDKDDGLMMDAYGDYLVDEIRGGDEGIYEICIALRPVKGGVA